MKSSLKAILLTLALASMPAIASATEIERIFVERAKAATAYYDLEVEAAFESFLNRTTTECEEYQPSDPLECIRKAHEDYLSGWKLSENPNVRLQGMTRVIAETYHCNGKCIEHFSYLLFAPEDTLVKKRVNALLEPLIEPKTARPPDEFSDEGECMANEFHSYQQIHYINDRYLGINHKGSAYFFRAAHPMHYGHSQHIDLRSGEVIPTESIFTRNNMQPLVEKCIKHLAKETEFELASYEEFYGEDVRAVFHDANYWAFTPAMARIEFPPYTAAAYAYGFMRCEFPFDQVKPFLSETFIKLITAHQN